MQPSEQVYSLPVAAARENRAEGGCLADCLQWEARVSDDRVRASFDETMKRSWDQSQIYYIGNRSRDFMPNAPGTVPFSPRELRLMAKLRIDWRQYRDDAKILLKKLFRK